MNCIAHIMQKIPDSEAKTQYQYTEIHNKKMKSFETMKNNKKQSHKTEIVLKS